MQCIDAGTKDSKHMDTAYGVVTNHIQTCLFLRQLVKSGRVERDGEMQLLLMHSFVCLFNILILYMYTCFENSMLHARICMTCS